MIPLYLYLMVGSVIVPMLYSIFYQDFIKYWKNFFISTSIIALIFLIWDAIFTYLGVWEFNESYCIGIRLFGMPIEEWFFFFVIPFCSLFLHFALVYVFPNIKLSRKTTQFIAGLIIVVSVILISTNFTKAYTFVNFIFLLIVMIIGLIFHVKLLQQFFLTFLIILIPFFIVNGILTGALTADPVVIYDDFENLGIRIGTIPMEDTGYAFTMLFGNLMIFQYLNTNLKKKNIVSIS